VGAPERLSKPLAALKVVRASANLPVFHSMLPGSAMAGKKEVPI